MSGSANEGRAPKKKGRAADQAPAKGEAKGFLAYLRHRHDPLTSLLLTVPVFLVYHLGILLIDVRNGVDLVSGLTFALLHQSLGAYIGVTLGYVAAIALAVFWLRKRGTIRPAEFLPVLGEALILAIVMTFTVGWATQHLFQWLSVAPAATTFAAQAGPPALGPVEKLVMAAGAGFHEELVFRVGLFAGGTFVLHKVVRIGEWKAALVMGLLSSIVFSAIHYVGPFGDPFTLLSFTFRVLAGVYLALVYRFRGFAVAVYTHAFYDIIVFFL
ncbi:MAG: CPBP family glutamic-type intramembrane protease [Sandaracinaceae bacterium]